MGRFRVLERAQITRDWTLEERAALGFFMTEAHYKDAEVVFARGSHDRAAYFIDSGSIRLQYENLSFDLKEGESFGELSLFNDNLKLVTATAVGSAQIWSLALEKFIELRKTAPSVAAKLSDSINLKFTRLLSESGLPQRMLTASLKPPSSTTSTTTSHL